jgi:hypothetical protein
VTHTGPINTAGVSSLGSERARVPVDRFPDGSLEGAARWQAENFRTAGMLMRDALKRQSKIRPKNGR